MKRTNSGWADSKARIGLGDEICDDQAQHHVAQMFVPAVKRIIVSAHGCIGKRTSRCLGWDPADGLQRRVWDVQRTTDA
jgi:hypothetical protein